MGVEPDHNSHFVLTQPSITHVSTLRLPDVHAYDYISKATPYANLEIRLWRGNGLKYYTCSYHQ